MKKPSGLLLALGLGKPGSKKPMKEDEVQKSVIDDESSDSDLDSAADDMFDALKADDREAFRLAVRAVKECSYEEDE